MRRYIMGIFFIVFGVLACLADTTEAVEVVLKSGRVVRGELIREDRDFYYASAIFKQDRNFQVEYQNN